MPTKRSKGLGSLKRRLLTSKIDYALLKTVPKMPKHAQSRQKRLLIRVEEAIRSQSLAKRQPLTGFQRSQHDPWNDDCPGKCACGA